MASSMKCLLTIFGRKPCLLGRILSKSSDPYKSIFRTMASQSNYIRPFTIVVEGNIGSGKTTFIEHFKNQDICILDEPVDMWRNCCGENLLELMYKDRSKWVFTFQSYVQLTMLRLHLQPTNQPIKLMERSIFSARYCFVENSIREGILPVPSAKVLHEWFKWCISNSGVNVDLIIYLRTSPEVAFDRMKNRNRSEENTVPLEYLTKLHELHEEWLVYKTKFDCQIPIITINGDMNISDISKEYKKYEPIILQKVPQRNVVGT